MPKTTAKKKIVTSRVRPRWTKEEVALLKRLYRTHSNAEIAEILGRKVSSVVFKGHRLGLAKGARRLKEMGRENIRRRWEPLKEKAAKKTAVAAKKTAVAAKKTAVAKKKAVAKKAVAAKKPAAAKKAVVSKKAVAPKRAVAPKKKAVAKKKAAPKKKAAAKKRSAK